jgi:hypothetical protein
LRAACATRTFARTETFIPTTPAVALAIAPSKKPAAYHQFRKNPIRSRIGTPTSATVRYWRERKAPAPARIAAAISLARGVEVGAASTRR